MAKALEYAVEYGRELDQVYPYTLYFGDLYATPNNNRFRWINAKTIEIPRISTTGRVNADRDTIGKATRNYDNSWETKTLSFFRKWSTLVHPQDVDETNLATSIGNITRVYNEEQKFPEMDAYTISKLYQAWTTAVEEEGYFAGVPDETELSEANVLSVFDKLMLNMDNARVPATGRILYTTFEVKTMLKNAEKLQRTLDVQSASQEINRVVSRLDEVKIIGVPATLMKTSYNFTEGYADNGGSQINMFLVHPSAVITPVKYTFADLDAPTAITEGKWYYYEESYGDVFILNNKAAALQFNITRAE